MADEASRPLLDDQTRSSSEFVVTERTTHQTSRSFELSSESTPLLHRRNEDITTYGTERGRSSRSPSTISRRSGSPESTSTKKQSHLRWPSIVSLALLTTGVLAILLFAFLTPAVVKEYANEAAIFKPTALSVDSTTADGVRARVQGEFVMDATRVKNKAIRGFGRFVTWVATEVETGHSDVEVYLPEYGNVLIGTATLPSIIVNIRNGNINEIDFLADLAAGDVQGLHGIAMDWIEGRLGRLSLKGKATLHLKTGLLRLGTQVMTNTITLEESDFPAIPAVKVSQLNVHDAEDGAMQAEALVSSIVNSPVALTVPALGFEILVPNCSPGDPNIMVAKAQTSQIRVEPEVETTVGVKGFVKNLPDELTKNCPGEEGSPLDYLVSSYIQGNETTIFVRGSDAPTPQAPAWMVDLLRSVTIPLPFTGHALDNLVKNFTMTDTHFSLPDPFSEPDTPAAQPSVSALVKVIISLPKNMNFELDVPKIRALTNVFFEGKELGTLNINDWQEANSTLVHDGQNGSTSLLVDFTIKDAPLNVTDSTLLSRIVQGILFGTEPIVLHVDATVDAKISTGLGLFAIRGIPADGNFPVKSLSNDLRFGIDMLLAPTNNTLDLINLIDPNIVSIHIDETTESSLQVSAVMNFTNPTEYTAEIPFVDFLMLYNSTPVAHVVARNFSLGLGSNSDAVLQITWGPLEIGGPNGTKAGRSLISSYISGSNTTVTIRAHEGTIPALPELGKAMSDLEIVIPLPPFSGPGSPDDDGGDKRTPLLQDATLHLWSSTADFLLFSPLEEKSITVTSIHATAFYKEDEPLGKIRWNQPFIVPPGLSRTPRLPVDLVLGGGAYDALRKALGQSLKLNTVAQIGVQVDNYRDVVLYTGKDIDANIRV
ncbi:hypothetical protein N7468_005414 [Penicillium chermesinum]|uniref:Pre-rRNA processing protein n=1 Tax=Penicillium chermesinum TaxID=63820 RepID=A0A9W9NZ66_9EURO|nr:uncharacterized protein N7468_005414 [Penicillium chermesinum]KAJ5232458.1 hypothetical protein N7468_005414 [Penicillium chermesinum]KAJ6172116.1 hypothetical protein N7470_001183 [Penicillium chermesinum]